jgi:hypothetical protein
MSSVSKAKAGESLHVYGDVCPNSFVVRRNGRQIGQLVGVDTEATVCSDAHRPCKSCVRAHANLIANLVKRGKPFPAHPDCVYDGDSPGLYDSSQTVDLNGMLSKIWTVNFYIISLCRQERYGGQVFIQIATGVP